MLNMFVRILFETVLLFIGVGSGKFFGIWRIFARILPTFPAKNSIQSGLQKKWLFLWFWAPFFSKEGMLDAIFSSYFQGVCEGIQRFCPDFTRFCPDFKEFCPDFHQIKTLEVRLQPLHPRLLHQCCCWMKKPC